MNICLPYLVWKEDFYLQYFKIAIFIFHCHLSSLEPSTTTKGTTTGTMTSISNIPTTITGMGTVTGSDGIGTVYIYVYICIYL